MDLETRLREAVLKELPEIRLRISSVDIQARYFRLPIIIEGCFDMLEYDTETDEIILMYEVDRYPEENEKRSLFIGKLNSLPHPVSEQEPPYSGS